MHSILSAFGLAVVVFASTNVDDFLLLVAFYSDSRIPNFTVIWGQFIGIGLLTGISWLAALLTLRIPQNWMVLLGVAPLLLGLQKLFALRRLPGTEREKNRQWTKVRGISSVTFATIANGGDNLAATIPFFANKMRSAWIYVFVFLAMTAVWCWLGWLLTKHSGFASRLQKYGQIVLPLVLILLGISVLARFILR